LAKPTLLIIGVSGLLGYKLAKLAQGKFSLYGTYNYRKVLPDSCETSQLDITKENDTRKFVEELRPDIIVNTSAIHSVDYCETNKEEAWKVNVTAQNNLATTANKIGARLIGISTDYVFDGRKGNYIENDEPSPLNYYGLTKLEGEKALQKLASYAVVRSSVIYGWASLHLGNIESSSHKSINFAMWCMVKLFSRQEIKIVTDQYSNPILTDNVTEVIMKLIKSEHNGIYHVAGLSCLNRYDFVMKLTQTMNFDAGLVKPITTDQLKQIARRPKNCCLNCTKVMKDLGAKLLTVDESLQLMRKQSEAEMYDLLHKIK
jgi:dTDP-4-dehydrorhamnose reductase